MKIKNILKKSLAFVLVIAMLAPIMGNIGTNAGLVHATEEEEPVGYVKVQGNDVTTGGTNELPVYTANDYPGYIFAGWYTEEDAVASSEETRAYARFVPEDVLSTKVQVTEGIVTNTENENYRNKYVMRFVSSVDSLDYQKVGFELSYPNPDDKTKTITKESVTYTVFERIDSTTGSTDGGTDTYNFSPKVMDTKSEYFITSKLPVDNTENAKDTNYTVRAYWVTKDGIKVYGKERCISVNDGLNEDRLNLTVDGELTVGGDYGVSYNDRAGNPVPGATVEVLTAGNGYSNVRISSASRENTKSVTTVTISDGTTTATGLYRNLYTKYTGDGTADTTWYDMYSSTEKEFVIASSADLYGLSQLSNTKLLSFEGMKIYVVADIAVNTEKLELLDNEHYLDWYTYDKEQQKVYTDRPSREWKPIGGVNKYFKGTFDGQGHTISGIYIRTLRYAGLFGCLGGTVTNGTATIRDIKIKNSHITTAENDAGSVVGCFEGGIIENVYSDAIISSSNGDSRAGGLVGTIFSTSSMVNCWYAGKIVKTRPGVGGLVGTIMNGGTLDMTSCLNTGTIDVSGISDSQPWAGGLIAKIGNAATSTARANITDSLHAANIVLGANHRQSNGGYGGLACVNSKATLSIKNVGVAGTDRSVYNATGATNLGDSIPPFHTSLDTISGSEARQKMPKLGWDKTWKTVAYGTPVLAEFEEEAFDTSWYNEDKSVFVIEDKGDLYGLAELSKQNDFAGKTVKLVNDIIINTGSAEEWAAGKVPTNKWTPIGSEGDGVVNHFAGTFDGGMHTISGIHHITSAKYSGLFGGTAAGSTISNLKLKNSYFKSTFDGYAYIGSIAGVATGTFESIYSDAIVVIDRSGAGGLIGRVNGSSNRMENCWFAGKLSHIGGGGSDQFYGGLVGYLPGALTMSNCLNTGTVSTNSVQLYFSLGGLIGALETTTAPNINNCLNVGLIQQTPGKTSYYGPIVGHNFKSTVPNITNCYATLESSTNNTFTGVTTSHSEVEIIGDLAKSKLQGFDFENTWATVSYETPVLKSFINEDDGRIDASWYDADAPEYTLYDEQDLYGFAMISKTEDFANKTVKLGADIVVNEGTASAEWATKSNYRQWFPIGNSSYSFKGNFNGQGYTIEGLYINASSNNIGLFGYVGSAGTLQNFNLINSYMKSTGKDFGGVAGSGYGSLYRIYCDVIVDGSNDRVGGLIGQAGGTMNQTIASCWFAGNVKNSSKDKRNTGGFVGGIYANSLTIYNSLNTGVVDASAYETVTDEKLSPTAGGFVGYIEKNTLSLNQCLNLGEIIVHADANHAYGPFVGYSKHNVCVVMSACYTTMDLGDYNIVAHNNLAANYDVVSVEDVLADAETQKSTMPNLSWGTNWIAGDKVNPSIKFDYAISGSGVNYSATDTDLEMLNKQYSGRALYQGEMHDHAKTYGRGQDIAGILPVPGDDGKVDLKTWETQMDTLGLDFAASLDHNQIDHYGLLDHSKFIYGSEAEAEIYTDDSYKADTYIGALHFDMIFKSQNDFMKFINEHSKYFDYGTKLGNNFTSFDGFSYDKMKFSKKEFSDFIRDIIEAGGVFNLPHPLQNDDYITTELEDYYFEVMDASRKQLIYGFQVINDVRGAASTTRNLKTWKELLARGYRLYATAGSDSHGDLRNESLTSIYATTHDGTKCNGSCNIADCSGYDKGNMISQLQSGDYAAGNVAIQMCIYEGDNATPMGGSCDFSGNKRLVISMGNILKTDTLKEGDTYRVDVLNEKGVVYSQYIDPFKTTTLALDVQDCGFYRVEIYDINHATSSKHKNTDLDKYPTGLISAVGNPIWNGEYNWNNN